MAESADRIAALEARVRELERERLALRESEHRLRSVLEVLPAGVWFADAAGKIVLANPAGRRIWGGARYVGVEQYGEYKGWWADTGERIAAEEWALARALRGEVSLDEVIDIECFDGSRKTILNSAVPVRDQGGEIVGAVVVNLDLTGQKQTERQLQASEQRATTRAAELQTVLDTVPAAVWIARDPQGNDIAANRAGAELLRRPHGSNVSVTAGRDERPLNFRPMKDGREIPGDELPIQAAARFGKEIRDYEFDLAFDDGTVRHLLGNSSPIRDEGGRPRGSVGAFIDITGRKRAERSLREQEAKYRSLFENMTEEVHFWRVVRDGEGRIETWRLVDANPPALATWGRRTLEEIRGKTTDEIFGAGAAEHYRPIVERVMAERVPFAFEDYFPHLDRYFRFTTIPLGESFITTGADITSARKAQALVEQHNEALREANRRKDEFLGMLSHELRNPLAPIRNSIHILDRVDPGGEQARRAKAVIARQAEHLTRLVDDLLDVTRIARGKIELRRSRVDLREVVSRAADDFRLLMEERGVSFAAVLPDGELSAEADGMRITQVVGNLLHNAAKFTQRGDEVTLSLLAVGGEAELRVRDTGAGIPPALLPHVFDPFVQGERTLARTEGGLGLGLALVKGIVELHGGRVRAESAGAGAGAELVVSFPLVPAAATPGRFERSGRASRGKRVLVVDDNRDAAESLAQVVEMFGHSAEIAYDGPSALEKARASRPDVVLCDIGLPGMSGYDVAKALRAEGRLVQLVALTGYARPEDVRLSAEAGFDQHLAKPCDPADLQRLLG